MFLHSELFLSIGNKDFLVRNMNMWQAGVDTMKALGESVKEIRPSMNIDKTVTRSLLTRFIKLPSNTIYLFIINKMS